MEPTTVPAGRPGICGKDDDLFGPADFYHSKESNLVFSPDGALLVGVLLVGDISKAGLYRFVIKEKMAVSRIKSHIINHTLHYGHFICPSPA